MKKQPNFKHGFPKNNRLYVIWGGMRTRCNNPNFKAYKYYGGKGVKICKEWNEFINFYNWALNNGYKSDLTIDRVDSNKDYCPENCRWILASENSKKANVKKEYSFNNKTMNLKNWSIESGINYHTLRDRILKYHWSFEKAITTKVRQ